MQYAEVQLLRRVEVAEDRLGNPVFEVIAERSPYVGMLSGKASLPQDLDGRTVTENNPEIWTNAPPEKLRQAAGLQIGEDRFEVKEIYEELRGGWSLAVLDRWRQ